MSNKTEFDRLFINNFIGLKFIADGETRSLSLTPQFFLKTVEII